ncbi:MAG: HEAT repeat domain-containing protein [Acidobacteriota bacterium]
MQSLIVDTGVPGRAGAALMLATERDQATLDALRDALSDSDWSVRAAAVHAIALRKDPRLKSDLAPMLEDQNEGVRLRAAAGCLRLTRQRSTAAGG